MDPSYLPTTEYSRAMQTLKAGRNAFWWLLVISILVQVAAFVLVNWAHVLDGAQERVRIDIAAPATPSAATQAAEAPAGLAGEVGAIEQTAQAAATTQPATGAMIDIYSVEPPDKRARMWEFGLRWAMAATKFLAFVSALILAVLALVKVQISLVGRLGGAAALTRALMWSLVLLAMVTPWQQIFERSLVSGALYNLSDLVAQARTILWSQKAPGAWELVVYYARFLAYPVVTLLVALLVYGHWRQGYRSMVMTEPS